MNPRIMLAALVAATCLTTPVLAADLYTNAAPVVAPVPYADWSGVYVGLEGGFGSGHYSFDQFKSIGGFGGAGNFANVLSGNHNVFPDFTGPGVGPFDKISQRGWLLGGFAGAQKQSGNWVFGVEADFDAADIHGSLTSPRVSTGAVSLFSMDPAQANSVTNPDQFRTPIGMRR
jgi:outer membrane immunogenic protein